jgi:hypothetical protein
VLLREPVGLQSEEAIMLLVEEFMLNEVKIKQAKSEAKLYRLYDQGGLYGERKEE